VAFEKIYLAVADKNWWIWCLRFCIRDGWIIQAHDSEFSPMTGEEVSGRTHSVRHVTYPE